MWNEYAREKLRELDADLERARMKHAQPLPDVQPRRRVLAPVARVAGRRVRRFGEALEAWASPAAEECDQARRTA